MAKVSVIDIRPADLETVCTVLRRHVPDKEVWAFGSRVHTQWTARDYSDLDLAICTDEPIPLKVMGAISEELSESNLPMKVDVLDMASVDEKFRKIIAEEYAVVQGRGGSSFVYFGKAVEINPKVQLERGEAYPYVDMKQINPNLRSVNTTESKKYKGSGSRFQPGDTLMARITPCLENGKIARFASDSQPGHGSTEFIVVRGKKGVTDNDFAYYLTRSPKVRSFAVAQMTGSSGRQRVPTNSLSKLEVLLPPLTEQKKIARILGTLDDKIELNRQMNKTLEAMAQAIFKSWFVDFDPVHAKAEGRDTGLPPEVADLFPDGFEDSELGKIPQGWRVKSLGEIAEIRMGQSPPGNTYNDEGIGLPFYQGVADFQERYPKRHVFCDAPTRFAEPGDILLSVRAPIGRINLATEQCAIGRGLVGVRATDFANQGFLEYTLRKESGRWHILESQGSVFGNAKKSDILHLPILWPGKKYCRTIARVLETLNNTEQMNGTLARLRDTLLPKLIRGELRFGEFEPST